MKLVEYINEIGVPKFADMVGVSTTQVYRYQSYQEIPKPAYARKIKKITHGLVDYKDIYDPYFEHHEGDPQLSFTLEE